MRILFCLPACEYSVTDVARGYRYALIRQGHELRDYDVGKRMVYHSRAIGPSYNEHVAHVSKAASENILNEAIYFGAEAVVLVSSLVYHPVGIALLRFPKIRLAVLHTESPYCDEQQLEWSGAYPEALHCTHDKGSAEKLGWLYLPHAYDASIHRPSFDMAWTTDGGARIREWNNTVDERSDKACDVLFLGTGWPERIAFLEQIDWTGINLKIMGFWEHLAKDSPLRPYYVEGMVQNEIAVQHYRSAKINLNIHRFGEAAYGLNPRAFELAACGAFTLTDSRPEGALLFGETQPTFSTPAELEALIRRYLADPVGRRRLAEQARERVEGQTFDARAAVLMAALSTSPAA